MFVILKHWIEVWENEWETFSQGLHNGNTYYHSLQIINLTYKIHILTKFCWQTSKFSLFKNKSRHRIVVLIKYDWWGLIYMRWRAVSKNVRWYYNEIIFKYALQKHIEIVEIPDIIYIMKIQLLPCFLCTHCMGLNLIYFI